MVLRLAKVPGLTITELAAPLPIGLPTVLKHLDILSRAGLIERRKSGRTVTVSLVPDAMTEAGEWLDRTAAFWTGRLDRLAALVETEETS
jgi:DNA-binding transcriptional ArsR family regulator